MHVAQNNVAALAVARAQRWLWLWLGLGLGTDWLTHTAKTQDATRNRNSNSRDSHATFAWRERARFEPKLQSQVATRSAQSASQAVCQLAGESVSQRLDSACLPGELRVGVIDNRWQCKLGAYIKTCGSFASLGRCLHLNDFYTLQSDGHEIEAQKPRDQSRATRTRGPQS